jgi:hypothetical protein
MPKRVVWNVPQMSDDEFSVTGLALQPREARAEGTAKTARQG